MRVTGDTSDQGCSSDRTEIWNAQGEPVSLGMQSVAIFGIGGVGMSAVVVAVVPGATSGPSAWAAGASSYSVKFVTNSGSGEFVEISWDEALGIATGFLPMRDIAKILPQNTVKRISPPTFASRASWSAMIPFGVDKTEIPRPLFTRGRFFTEA